MDTPMYTSVTGEEYVLEPGERGEKQQHSPWSAPRDRRKRNKHNPSPLTISEDFEYTSPPKRHNDGQSPAARALRMSQGLDDHIPALHTAGPLAQGLFHRSSPGPPDRKKYSPLQAGLDVASFRDIQTLQSSISGRRSHAAASPDSLRRTPSPSPAPPASPVPAPAPPSVGGSSPATSMVDAQGCGLLSTLRALGPDPAQHARHGEDVGAGSLLSAPALSAPAHGQATPPRPRRGQGHWWQARTPARTTTSSLDPGSTRSSDRASRGSSQRKTCFTCPSPFCLGLSPARDSDSDEEVSVRRPGAGADGFVLRTRADFQLATPRGAAVGADLVRESRRAALSSGGRPKEPAAEPSVRSSRDAQPLTSRFGLSRAALEAPHPPARSSTFHAPAAACWPERGLTPNSEGGGSEGPCPGMGAACETPLSVDHLNDMLRDLCSLGPSNPRDAEAMVRDACTGGGLVPNAATLRTLDKIWAVHEQLHGQY
uniref:Uncharacterized protein n=1 Tax=Auxenochlorella protothecoides TaxID=3075 RepID=A0A1D2AFA4_AUXPR